MTFINTCADVDDLGGGRFRHTQHIKPVAYDDNGTLRAIASAFTASGKADRPHAVRAARLMTSVADDGMRRIHPTREEDRYVEIGTPYVKIGGVWRKMGFRGGMRTANHLTWMSPQANMSIVHAGHYVKLEIELKRGYVPEDNLVAFPVGLNGLKRSGANILSDGRTVMHLRAPTMYDAANEMDRRDIDGKFVSLAGQPYYLMALPDLTGMSRPVIDPTLALQPDAAAGQDTGLSSQNIGTPVYTSRNYGVSQSFIVFGNALLFWNLADLPPMATVTAATMTLTVGAPRTSNRSCYFYELAVANHDWPEGTKSSQLGVAGDSCWNFKEQTPGSETPWDGAAGASLAGTDYIDTVLGSFLYTANDPAGTPVVSSLTAPGIARVQACAGSGLHIIIVQGVFSVECATSDHNTAAYRPKLTIEYTLPGGGNIFQSAILHSSLYGKTLVR